MPNQHEMDRCQKCGSTDIVCMEYAHDSPEHYDGISEIRCQSCNVRIGRWSGRVLADGEMEKRYGGT